MMVRLLPVPLKLKKKIEQLDRTAQQNRNRGVIEEALQIILEPLIATGKDRIIADWANLQRKKC